MLLYTFVIFLLKDAFDHADAVKEGKIIPKDGADSEYDQVQVDLEEVKNESERYLKQITGQLKTRVSYFGSAKNRFQLEVSDNTKVPREFELSSSKKGYKRYMTAETKVNRPKTFVSIHLLTVE